MAALLNHGEGPALPLHGEAAAEELRGRLCALVDTTRAAARHDLGERAFDALEMQFMDEMEDMRASATAIRQGPKSLPALHNWVAYQDLLASLSASGWWPRHAHAGLGRMAARLNLLARRKPIREKRVAQLPAAPSDEAAVLPLGSRGPDQNHPQRWRAAALRKHLGILRDKAPPFREHPLGIDGHGGRGNTAYSHHPLHRGPNWG